ncbi:hypothetical protein PVK06_008885 [Gossypium arboreum]|uniref:Uncharacterized protein n=1 Tax=Gossypium arboreum TaxID=29729 RepID=A0ABR0QLH2_GOSAR|nr:hypothetical protein PVK06_008885 [Gossypium arboreum]
MVKDVHNVLQDDHNEELEEDQDPPPASSSAQLSTQPLSDEMSLVILGAITSLTDEFKGFSTQVDDAFEHFNDNFRGLDSRMSRMEENIAFLMSQFLLPPPPLSPQGD